MILVGERKKINKLIACGWFVLLIAVILYLCEGVTSTNAAQAVTMPGDTDLIGDAYKITGVFIVTFVAAVFGAIIGGLFARQGLCFMAFILPVFLGSMGSLWGTDFKTAAAAIRHWMAVLYPITGQTVGLAFSWLTGAVVGGGLGGALGGIIVSYRVARYMAGGAVVGTLGLVLLAYQEDDTRILDAASAGMGVLVGAIIGFFVWRIVRNRISEVQSKEWRPYIYGAIGGATGGLIAGFMGLWANAH